MVEPKLWNELTLANRIRCRRSCFFKQPRDREMLSGRSTESVRTNDSFLSWFTVVFKLTLLILLLL